MLLSTIVCLVGWTIVTLFQAYAERETALCSGYDRCVLACVSIFCPQVSLDSTPKTRARVLAGDFLYRVVYRLNRPVQNAIISS